MQHQHPFTPPCPNSALSHHRLQPATVQDTVLHPQSCLIPSMLTLTAMSWGGLNWMWNAWWVLADSIVERGSLGGEQRHCSSLLIEFDSTTGGGKKNVLLLSFRTERGPFSVSPFSPPLPTHQPILPYFYHITPFFSLLIKTGCHFLLTPCLAVHTAHFTKILLWIYQECLRYSTWHCWAVL